MLFREVIPPEKKELPDCAGYWCRHGSVVQVGEGVNAAMYWVGVYGYNDKRPFKELAKGEWIYLSPIIETAIKDAK